jgi:hypothetical protein
VLRRRATPRCRSLPAIHRGLGRCVTPTPAPAPAHPVLIVVARESRRGGASATRACRRSTPCFRSLSATLPRLSGGPTVAVAATRGAEPAPAPAHPLLVPSCVVALAVQFADAPRAPFLRLTPRSRPASFCGGGAAAPDSREELPRGRWEAGCQQPSPERGTQFHTCCCHGVSPVEPFMLFRGAKVTEAVTGARGPIQWNRAEMHPVAERRFLRLRRVPSRPELLRRRRGSSNLPEITSAWSGGPCQVDRN